MITHYLATPAVKEGLARPHEAVRAACAKRAIETIYLSLERDPENSV